MVATERTIEALARREIRFLVSQLLRANRREDLDGVWHYLHAFRALRTELLERGRWTIEMEEDVAIVKEAMDRFKFQDWL